jgi:4-azaleucine resistance transporter AzlC
MFGGMMLRPRSRPPSSGSRGREFLAGCRDELPILLGVAPFGMIYGALALSAGLPSLAAQAMSSMIFAGSAQFIAAQLFREGAPGLVIVVTVFVVNLRHALYSASVAPHLRHLGRAWKVVLAYLLTDEAYAVAISRYVRDDVKGAGPAPRAHWYFLGAGLTLWTCWQVSTAVGVFLGARVPQSWSLEFTLPLTFIALVFPTLKDRAAVAAAVAAGVLSVLTVNLPYKMGLLVAAAVGVVAGLALERSPSVRPERGEAESRGGRA